MATTDKVMPGLDFILGSASPRRREMLASAGFCFEVLAAQTDETLTDPDIGPEEAAALLARDKCRAVADRRPGQLVLAADTIVVCQGRMLGKPLDQAQARQMLIDLSGRAHQVLTGFCLGRDEDHLFGRVVMTEVVFRDLSTEEIAAYAATGSPLDKAGAYGIQDLGGGLVRSIHGSYTNVVGLPVAEVIEALADLGINPGPGV